MIELDVAAVFLGLEEHLHAELTASAVEEVRRIRLVGADDLVRTVIIHVHAPLGDVEMVCAPVAVVSGTDIVVKAPEHRIELVHTLRRELVRVRTPLGRTEPHVPAGFAELLIAVALCCCIRRDIKEADGMGRPAELLAADAVVGVHVLEVADEAVADDHDCRAELAHLRPAALHRTRLEDAAVLLLGGDDLAGLVDGERERLLAVDVLAVLHRLDADVGMPVVRRRDAHRIDRRVLEDVAEVRATLARRVLVEVVDALDAVFHARLVAVADQRDARVFLVKELRQQRATALNADADHRDVDRLARLAGANAHLARVASGKRCRGGGSEKKVTTVDFHLTLLLK